MQRDHNGYTPLHAIVSSSRCDRIECLLILMVHSEYGTVLIDMLGGKNNQTALHIAVQVLLNFIPLLIYVSSHL